MKTLFCPKCGKALTRHAEGSLECVPGQMPLAQELAQRLVDCYDTEARRPRDPDLAQYRGSAGIGGEWFCPGCGVHTQESSPWDLRCPACSRSLFEFAHSLIERHPHLMGDGKWR